MGSLGLGLGQNDLKLGQLFSENRFGCWGNDGGRLRRRVKVVSGGGAAGLKIGSNSSLNISMLNSNKMDERKRSMDKEDLVSGNIDQWIRDSVQQIVRNIEEAPFLVHVFPEDEEGSRRSSKVKIVREKASANSWPNVKLRWERGSSSVPNGIALVEELKTGDNDDLLQENEDDEQCSSTKVFGIVIQERGLGFPVCYMLKTSKVRSISGICTHFCMFRVECFGETADVQFKKQWLL